MAKVKEKIKHFLHPEKPSVTTPDGSPGYTDVKTTTNIPEAFFPGAKAVVPEETHSTQPYSSALGQRQAPSAQPAPAVPADPAAMLGAPPSGNAAKAAGPADSTTAAPDSDDRGLNPISGAPDQTEGEGRKVGSKEPLSTDAETKDYDPATESDAQTTEIPSDVGIEDTPGNESKVQTEDYPATDEVVESKDYNPNTELEGDRNTEKIDPVNEEQEDHINASNAEKTGDEKTGDGKIAEENF